MKYNETLEHLIGGKDLDRGGMTELMDLIMDGVLTPAQIAAVLVALRIKGETSTEIAAAAISMREHATPVDAGGGPVLDIVGTGGDGLHTINVSTAAAFVAAGAGVTVAKHGNRSVSSKCGSADVLKALGVNIEADSELVSQCIQEVGIGFLFAPVLHGAMKHAIGPRRELGVRTIFNILGPLTNPARAQHLVLGVFKPELVKTYAEVLNEMGVAHAMIAHGNDGLDEISGTTTSVAAELKDGVITYFDFDPHDYVPKLCELGDLRGGTAEKNAEILRNILTGKEQEHKRNIVLLNAAAGIYVAGKAESYAQGFEMAQASIDDGHALAKLEQLISVSNSQPE